MSEDLGDGIRYVPVRCPLCGGDGLGPPICTSCGGRGYKGPTGTQRIVLPCMACCGTGHLFIPCRTCGGRGWRRGAAAQTGQKVADEATRRLIDGLVDDQAKALLVAAKEHIQLGDMSGSYRLLCHAMRLGGCESGKKAANKVQNLKLRCERVTKKMRRYLEREQIEAAIKSHRAIVDGCPGTPMAAGAERLFSSYRRNPKTAPAILYEEALMMEEDGRKDEARKQYEDLMKRYPTSLPALRARKRLKKLGAE